MDVSLSYRKMGVIAGANGSIRGAAMMGQDEKAVARLFRRLKFEKIVVSLPDAPSY